MASTITDLGHVTIAAERLRTSWHTEVKAIRLSAYSIDNSWKLGHVSGIAYALGLLLGQTTSDMTTLLQQEHEAWCAAQIH